MMQGDNYIEDDTRTVLFKWKRYRVVKSSITMSYSLWYSGNIIAIDPNRSKIMDRFKEVIQEWNEVTA